MLIQTRGMVLFHFKYSESSVITRIYTEELGLQSYIIPGARKKKAKIKTALLQPFTLLDLVVHHKAKGGLQRVKEATVQSETGTHMLGNVFKSSMAMFLSEVIYQCIKEEEKNTDLYAFIQQAAELLHDENSKNVNFHIWFLLAFSKFLGFQPTGNWEEGSYFDIQEGCFVPAQPLHNYFCLAEESRQLAYLINNLNTPYNIEMNNVQRRKLLDILLDYYRLHVENFGDIKSRHVLETVMM